ncbi:hypothetical protein [Aeromicrobium piscarium]|uniref:Uncharacterized protein n=1 Tax=Aeromicrobium piscarium TaxID=2590901 RepID=A0A554RWZ4_9ACTN|nr:hypothetical protein [Aeromicrobium piscarium]TSD58621.1 hypothetical protein FNM00_14100 [Aeromicrobium piscarium]
MMLTGRIAHAVADGAVAVAYRRWRVPRVTAGSTFRTVAGIIRVDRIDRIEASALTEADALAAGHSSLAELISTFRGTDADPVFRIALSWAGADQREVLGDCADLAPQDIEAIDALLDRLDARTSWARATLGRIGDRPGVTAAELAGHLPIEKESLKRRLRTLKEHGLTRSLTRGYDLSPRGRAYLDRSRAGSDDS